MTARINATGPEPTRVPTLAAAARWYATAGIPVMPLHHTAAGVCSCTAGPECGSPGKHPRLPHGLHEAATDSHRVRAWWRRWPEANIGLATGGKLDVCDIDTTTGLSTVLDVLDVVRPAGPLVRTGHGWHLWFAADGLPSRISLLPGVDWRGRGGYAVAPPSLHASGRWYTFQQPWNAAEALPECPPALRQLVQPAPPDIVPPAGSGEVGDVHRYAQAALDGELARIHAAPRPVYSGGRRVTGGGRNNALHLAAFRLGQLAARSGLDQSVVRPQLLGAARNVGLSAAEAERTIASGWHAGLRRPRAVVPRAGRGARW
ncbi:bifunctional DNA primase/polymerase [Catenuloplanes japonicus]|uniref:bifunctional DNA primase/polymerase n=1 Tax=Catenuloplanes japonicus TaxID=33876 RepID=UPI00068BB736|nr:bifunctional DNA primase/polymerase [Catenuloplanes japonicus]